MSRRLFRHRAWFLAAVVAVALSPSATWAGVGFGISGPASVDTRLPVVTVEDPPANTVLQGGQMISLNWSLTDDNPSLDPADNVAQMWIGDVLHETRPFSPGTGSHNWVWTVADTSSANAHLEIRSADAYGNLTVQVGGNFTILSTATDVPVTSFAAVFAQPSPNPFNPKTRLQFHLPAAGSVLVTVHDARGYLVDTLLREFRPAGAFDLTWDGTDRAGRRQAGGTYFFRLVYPDAGQSSQIVRKAVLLP
jgi:hypothetical protein